MNDKVQHGAAKLQSSAMVAAAFITTLGAITAACIQTGWINRPLLSSLVHVQRPDTETLPDKPALAQAAFLGTITPVDAQLTDSAPISGSDVQPAALERDINNQAAKVQATAPQTWPATRSSATLHQSAMKQTPSAGVIQTSAYQTTAYHVAVPSIAPAATAPSGTVAQLAAMAPLVAVPPVSVTADTTPEAKQTVGYTPALAPEATLLADDGAVKILPSPWSFLPKATASDKPADTAKAAKKLVDWGAMARFFSGHD